MKIIVKIYGGLGNQLFQYAFARRLANKAGMPLCIDLNWFSNIDSKTTSRNFVLEKFKIKARKISPAEKALLALLNKRCIPKFVRNKFFEFRTERCLQGTAGSEPVSRSLYLDGYWQDYKAFHDIRNVLVEDLRVQENALPDTHPLLAQIEKQNSVAVHIRRGDYTSSKINQSVYYECDEHYYDAAFQYIESTLQRPHYFIFSDDIEWAKNHVVPGGETTYVSNKNDTDEIRDFYLMTNCSHFIIANSTFSWWAAYLSTRCIQKIVVAPQKWFRDNANADSKLILDEWIKL